MLGEMEMRLNNLYGGRDFAMVQSGGSLAGGAPPFIWLHIHLQPPAFGLTLSTDRPMVYSEGHDKYSESQGISAQLSTKLNRSIWTAVMFSLKHNYLIHDDLEFDHSTSKNTS